MALHTGETRSSHRPNHHFPERLHHDPKRVFLNQLLDLEKQPAARRYTDGQYDLNRYGDWLSSMGSPQTGQVFLHIAGTKGKGSTASIAEGLLRGFGFPTALYTSPHLDHFGQRYRYDGAPWTLDEFESCLDAFIEGLLPEQRIGFEGPHPFRTVFETLTALALVAFRRRGRELAADGIRLPQIVIWETGLGGRLDCTNVVDPAASVITTLGFDHQKLLGTTIEQIAGEKAGIIKRGRPVYVSRQQPQLFNAVWPVLRGKAEETGSPIVRSWEVCPVLQSRDTQRGLSGTVRLPDGAEMEFAIPLRGSFQAINFESALAACWHLARDYGVVPTPETIATGLQLVHWPGRLEVHHGADGSLLILDGAHCPLSASALGGEIRRILANERAARAVLLCGMQSDKDHRAFFHSLAAAAGRDCIECLYAHPVDGSRTARPEQLAAAARDCGLIALECADLESAFTRAAEHGIPVVATGSLYMLGRIRCLWREHTARRTGESTGGCLAS